MHPIAASSVITPTFQELVAHAEIIFVGEVVGVQSRLTSDRDSQAIVTIVSYRVNRVLKGAVGATIDLEFLGGTVGDRTLRIDGVPHFASGDRDILFALPSRRAVSPLVSLMFGRVRIVADAATRRDLIRKFDGSPVRDTFGAPFFGRDDRLSQTPAMSVETFESRVRAEVARQRASPR